jgi:hypothetical protein
MNMDNLTAHLAGFNEKMCKTHGFLSEFFWNWFDATNFASPGDGIFCRGRLRF